ncbi:hypothetical protein BS17DRAFT_384243 [Gyrodon lividus]|nr:hypothetical protein BS17DRAFT_384243 [Gyrodon lividus]
MFIEKCWSPCSPMTRPSAEEVLLFVSTPQNIQSLPVHTPLPGPYEPVSLDSFPESSRSPPSIQSTALPILVNVILFGETGVGKSAVVNLLCGCSVARISTDVDGCTLASSAFALSLHSKFVCVYDTVGLGQPTGGLPAVEEAYKLVRSLSKAGGIHLLVFCLRAGRITASEKRNYDLFVNILCRRKVPVVLVFTGLEREIRMEDWWERNVSAIRQYGIHSIGHACVTTVRDEEDKYIESQRTIREVLQVVTHVAQDSPFQVEERAGKGNITTLFKRMNPFLSEKRHAELEAEDFSKEWSRGFSL